MLELENLEHFFFRAMKTGWASGNDGQLAPHRPDWTMVVYKGDPEFPGLALVDQWGNDPDSGKSSGNTIILRIAVPEWIMWYGGGSYTKEALTFLQESLMENYNKGEFYGGRGPRVRHSGSLYYLNECMGDFSRFRGREVIENPSKGREHMDAGFHEYWGGSLVYLNK